ncbi:MAG: hypothetical protein KDI71_19025 [Xanthomonadales bacterium]|nr:hypothetical protein [Xanthomonadales bacterium]
MFSTLQTGHLPLARRRLRASLAAGVMLSLYAHADSVPVYTEYSALTAGSLTRGEFGTSLAVIDDKLFVGAPAADFSSRSSGDGGGGGGGGTINDSGAVSRWERAANGKFAEVGSAAILPPPVVGGRFGTALDSFGDRLAVTQSSPSMLRIYQISAGATLEAQLFPLAMGTQGSSPMVSTTLFASHAAVGVVRNFDDSGSVEIYTRVGGQWSSSYSIASPNPGVPGIGFGYSISMSEDSLFVGIPYFTTVNGQTLPGAVYEYQRPVAGPVWNLRGQFSLPADLPAAQPARYGISVDVKGSLLVVGAPQLATSAGGDQVGGVFIYQYDPAVDAWTLRQRLINPDLEDGAEFGFAVATNGSDVLVGAPRSNFFEGQAFLYARTGNDQWSLTQRMVRTATGSHRFGAEVALTSDKSSIISAPQFTAFRGAAYEFLPERFLIDGFE